MDYSSLVKEVYGACIKAANARGDRYRTPAMMHAFSDIKPPWVDFAVNLSASSVKDIANGPIPRRHGVLYISIYDHVDAGEAGLLSSVDYYNTALEFLSVNMVEFECSTVTSLSDVNKCLNRYLIEISFHTA